MKIRKLGLILAGLACFGTHANEATGAAKVITISNSVGTPHNPSETFYITTDQAQTTNPSNCSKSNRYVLLDASNISKSMLLTAYTAKTNINLSLWGNGCTEDNFPLVVQVSLVQ